MGLEKRLGCAGFPSTYLKYLENEREDLENELEELANKRWSRRMFIWLSPSATKNTGIFAFWLAAVLLNCAAFGCMLLLVWWPSSTAPDSANDPPVAAAVVANDAGASAPLVANKQPAKIVGTTGEFWMAVIVSAASGLLLLWTLWTLLYEPPATYRDKFLNDFLRAQDDVMKERDGAGGTNPV